MPKIYLLFLIAVMTICLTSCGQTAPTVATNSISQDAKQYTSTEVASHNQATDCWVIVDNKIYNVTDFVNIHPGGNKILAGCGKDISDLFNAKHSDKAKKTLANYLIGSVK